MDFYVVAYVGYEGIEHIIDVFTDFREAADKVREIRKIAEKNAELEKSDEDALYDGPYPEHNWVEEDRVCVMTKKPDDKTYSCCCDFCGVEPTKHVFY